MLTFFSVVFCCYSWWLVTEITTEKLVTLYEQMNLCIVTCLSISLPRFNIAGKNHYLHTQTHIHHQAGNLVCTHLKKLRKLINNKTMELDEYDQGEDLVRKEVAFRRCFLLLLLEWFTSFRIFLAAKWLETFWAEAKAQKENLRCWRKHFEWLNGNSTRR